MPKFRRRRKLAKRKLQLKLTFTSVGLVVLGLMMQHLVFVKEVAQLAEQLPNDGAVVLESAQGVSASAFLVAFAFLVPITFLVGVLTTFRVAGPVYRMEKHLGAIAGGENPGECRLRKGDELVELCQAMNQAVAKLREPAAKEILTAGDVKGPSAAPVPAALPTEPIVESTATCQVRPSL